MNKIITKFILLFVVTVCSNVFKTIAQPGIGISFIFSPSPSTNAFPTTGNLTHSFVATGNTDDNGALIAPAGMNIKFNGITYQKFVVSTNGWLALVPNSVAAIPASLSGGGYLNTNQLATYSGGYPLIAPYWDDLASNVVQYNWTGSVLWVRWACKVDKTNPLPASNLFWVRIDAITGIVSFNYYTSPPLYSVFGSPSASIGIAGACTGDYYSYEHGSGKTYADSSTAYNNISTLPTNISYNFTPYQHYDNCANARDLGTAGATCTFATYNINNATAGSAICATSDVNDVWFRVTKPAGMLNLKVTTSSASPACESSPGTSVEIFSACGTPIPGACAVTSSGNPGFGEVTVSRSCALEVLYVRVTNDGDVGGKFRICASDGGSAGSGGTTCANPTWICSIPYSQTGLSTLGMGFDYDSTNSSCHDPYMNGEDYVFAYTPTSNICVEIQVNSTGQFPGVFVFNGCPNLLATTNCIASSIATTGNMTINSVSLKAGTTYYIIVDNDSLSVPSNIPFDISITPTGPAPNNDACGAVSLGSIANNQSCVYTSHNNECATPSTLAYPVPSCGTFYNNVTGDSWFTFTAAFTGSLLIRTKQGAVNPTNDLCMAVYTGNCISLNLFACDDNSAGSSMPLLSIPVVNGNTYYIRLWTNHPNQTGSYEICITSACTPPNDLPCNAVFLAPGGSTSGYNTCAGSGGEPVNAAQCSPGGIINTVWYKTVVPASGTLKIRTHTHTLADTQIEAFLFPGGCSVASTNSQSRGCNDDGPDCGTQGGQSYHDFSDLSLTGLTAGDTVWIAVDGYTSMTGTFEITIIDGSSTYPPIAGADCAGAYDVCGPGNITVPDPGILGYGNICDFQSNYNCWQNGERNSAWYTVTVNPGVLQFDIQTFSDYDFIMWDITGMTNAQACAQIQAKTLTSIRCNWVTTIGGHTGISTANPNGDWEDSIRVVGAPRTFIILIDNWNPPASTTGYTLNWMGSPIAAVTPSVTWQGSADSTFTNANNWGTPPCNSVPSCAIDAFISSAGSGLQPTINSNVSVKNLLINPGASLRIKSGFTLDVCGNLTNNGTFIAEPGSTVRFTGPANQTVSGVLTGTNAFANFIIDKSSGTGSIILNNNVDISGNYQTMNNFSILNINGKYVKVGGNFFNINGNLTLTNVAGSTLEFNGTARQNFTNSSGSLSVNDVVMNKPSGKLHLTGLNSNLNIDSTLTLSSGIIVTGTNEVNMKYYLPACVMGQNASSYIIGKLRRKISNGNFSSPLIPASYDFPLGDSTLAPSGYELANITFNSATLVHDLTATFTRWAGTPPVGPVAAECIVATYNILELFNHGYWTFKRSTNVFSGNYTVSLYNTGMTNNTGLGWTVAKADTLSNVNLAASWSLQGSCVVASTAANTRRSQMNPVPGADATSFNHRYATAQSLIPLPVELLYFNALPKGKEVLCTWSTASETNNEFFEVERSEDGEEFKFIGRVPGYGNGISTEKRTYSLVDPEACEGIRYYRLKQVDIDGRFAYSDIVAVNCSGDKGMVNVYPNPARTEIITTFYETKDGTVVLQWIDAIGKIAKSETHDVMKGYNSIQTEISDLAEGIYFLRIKQSGDFSDTPDRQVKLIKH